MAVEFKLPDLGENIDSADVVDVLVSPGDEIDVDQPVIEAETDKATVEIPSSIAGKIKEVSVKKGDTIKVGQVILVVEDNGAPARAEKPGKAKKAKPEKDQEKEAAEATDKQEAKEKKADEKKRAAEAEAETEEEVEAKEKPKAEKEPAEKEKHEAPEREEPAAEYAPIPAAPSVRQFAREIGVDIHQVSGSGPGGRISIDDVKKYARERGSTAAAPARATMREPMSKLRKVAAARMADSWAAVPHVTLHAEADVTDLEAQRQKFKKVAEAKGGKLTITAIAIKVAAAALRKHPKVNASLDMDKHEVVLHQACHVGVAVDTPRGLVVPVIRDVDQKGIIDLARELTEFSGKARDGKLMPDDMSGATFTVTNLGGMGVGFFTPIVNLPQVAILGLGRATMQPVFNDGQFQPRLLMPLSLSFDHRLVDGADGARFLQWVVEALQNPLWMSME